MSRQTSRHGAGSEHGRHPGAWLPWLPALLLAGLAGPGQGQERPQPLFEVRTVNGTSVVGPLRELKADWSVSLFQSPLVQGEQVVSVRRVGVARPDPPTDEHVILTNGDRIPVREARLKDERFFFRHPDVAGGEET